MRRQAAVRVEVHARLAPPRTTCAEAEMVESPRPLLVLAGAQMRRHWHVQKEGNRCVVRKERCSNPFCFKGFSNYESARKEMIRCMKRHNARWRQRDYGLAGGKK